MVTTWELKILPLLLRPTEGVSVLLEVTTAGHGQLVAALLCAALRVEFDRQVDGTRDVDFVLGRDTSVIPEGSSGAPSSTSKTRGMGSTRLGNETKGGGLHGVATSSGASAAGTEPRPSCGPTVQDAGDSLRGPHRRRSELLPPGQKTGVWGLPGSGEAGGRLERVLRRGGSHRQRRGGSQRPRRSSLPGALDVPRSWYYCYRGVSTP